MTRSRGWIKYFRLVTSGYRKRHSVKFLLLLLKAQTAVKVPCLVLAFCLTSAMQPVLAQAPTPDTFTVNTTADVAIPIAAVGDGNCDSGPGRACTLREAILEANANTPPVDTINFAIPVAGPQVILLDGALPVLQITEGVVIDGSTQATGTGTPLIQIDGRNGAAGSGLIVRKTGSVLRALSIVNFGGDGILIEGAGPADPAANNRVEDCYIGVETDGTTPGPNGQHGILLQGEAQNNTIGGVGNGNLISGNGAFGVFINGNTSIGNKIQSNTIGLTANGNVALGNFDGVGVNNGTNLTIGTDGDNTNDNLEGNVIAGNTRHGIFLTATNNNVIAGNRIGTNLTSAVNLGNTQAGIVLVASNNSRIGTDGNGTSDDLEGNVIAANGEQGIRVVDGSQNTIIAGNLIGTNDTSVTGLGNGLEGINVSLGSDNTRIGSNLDGVSDVFEDNTIARSGRISTSSPGILVDSVAADPSNGTIITNNYVGTDAIGTAGLGNTFSGVIVQGPLNNTLIGTATVGAGNVLSSNSTSGLLLRGGASGTNNRVLGNIIGLTPSAAANLANGSGIILQNGTSSWNIGQGAGNIISGNTLEGIFAQGTVGSPVSSNVIADNFIGTDAGGIANRGNGRNGVLLGNNVSQNIIGGTGTNPTGDANVVAFNNTSNQIGQGGIVLTGTSITGNTLRGNRIFSNNGLGLDLGSDGVTNNDTGDADGGVNNLQNYPILNSVTSQGSTQIVGGTLNSVPNRAFDIDLYRNTSADNSGNGEGEIYVDTLQVTTGADGNIAFTFPAVNGAAFIGQSFSATATDVLSGETSEFSVSGAAVPAALTLSIAPTSVVENAGSNAATGTVTRNTATTSALVVNLASSDTNEATVAATVTIPAGQTFATFAIDARDDNLVDGTKIVTLTASAGGLTGTANLNVTDNDVAGITVTPLALATGEDGTQSTFTVRLNTQPSAEVLITVSSSNLAEGIINQSTLTFNAANYATPQTVTVTGVDDALVDGDQAYSIVTAPAQSTDPNYNTLNAADVSVTNRDNDVLTLSLVVNPTTFSEGAGNTAATATISRNSTGAASTVALASNDTGEATVPTSVVISAGQTSTTFNIAAVEDSLNDGAQAVQITASATGYNSATQTLSVLDNDGPTMTWETTSRVVREQNGSFAVTLVRNTSTATALNIVVFSSNNAALTLPSRVTILPGNRRVTFNVTPVNDTLATGTRNVSLTARAAGFNADTVAISVLDDDVATLGLNVRQSTLSEAAGTKATIGTVSRNFNLAAPLTITLTSLNASAIRVPSNIVIRGGQQRASFYVAAVDNDLAEATRNVTIVAQDTLRRASVNLQVTNNDVISMRIAPGRVSLRSGQTQQFRADVRGLLVRGVVFSATGGSITPAGLYIAPATPGTYRITATSLADRTRTATAIVIVTAVPTPTPTPSPSPEPTLGEPMRVWGYNQFGQLGDNSGTDRPSVTNVALPDGARALAAGGAHSLAVKADGTVWSWGLNRNGQLGDGTTTLRTRAVPVQGDAAQLRGAVQVAAGWYHSLALKSDGTVWSWGLNRDGQLGDGSRIERRTAVRVRELSNVKFIAAGVEFSAAITRDGSLWMWGRNTRGQLGNGNRESQAIPQRVLDQDGNPLRGVAMVSLGSQHALALTADGRAWAWGSNASGQLGDRSRLRQDILAARPIREVNVGGSTIDAPLCQAVASGYEHSLLLTRNGQLFSCGNNTLGQLGDGTEEDQSTFRPVIIDGGANIPRTVSIGAGAAHSVALGSDGLLRTWGWNARGTLGDATLTNRSKPVIVHNLRDVRLFATGYAHTLALGTFTLSNGNRAGKN